MWEKIWFLFLRKRAIKAKFWYYFPVLTNTVLKLPVVQQPGTLTCNLRNQGSRQHFSGFPSEKTVNHKYRAKFGAVVSQAEVISLLQLKLGKKPVVHTHTFIFRKWIKCNLMKLFVPNCVLVTAFDWCCCAPCNTGRLWVHMVNFGAG